MLPAYNEEVGIVSLVDKICAVAKREMLVYEIVIVDDASTDSTAQQVSRLSFHHPIELIQHQSNQGLAGAMRSGLAFVLQNGQSGDRIVTLDADDTQPPAAIPKLLSMIDEGYDVSIASRYQSGSRTIGVPMIRTIFTLVRQMAFQNHHTDPGRKRLHLWFPCLQL